MRSALRPVLCLTATLGMLWSTNAQAVPSDATNPHGNGRGHDITLSARTAPFGLIFSQVGGGDACESSLWGCIRSGRVETDAAVAPRQLPRGWSGQLTLRNSGHGLIERIRIRPGPGASVSSPVPEPQAALVFMVGLGIVATRIRRR
jgi:hypothetical protein